jgi:peptidyl-prolyl cis-trans isomerase SurA
LARLRLIAAIVLALMGLVGPCGPGSPAWAQSGPQRIAAVVNDDVITSQDLIDRLALTLATSGLPNDAATQQQLAPQVLRGFVDEKLQLQEASRLGLAVTDDEVDKAIDTIAQRNKTNRTDLIRYLSEHRLNPQSFRDQLRAQIAWIKVVGREVRPRIVVTQEQVDLAMKRNANAAADTELLLSEIMLPVYDRSQEANVLNDAQGLVRSIRGGADFAGLARQVSAAASAENGGDLGWVREAAIIPDLRAQIGALKTGEISDPLVSAAGIHIFQVRDRRSAAAGGSVDRDRVKQTLEQEQLERQASRYLRDLRRDAFIDVRL